jgi:hypothetical protein
MRVFVASGIAAFSLLALTGSAGAQVDLLKTHKCIMCHSVGTVGNQKGKLEGVGSKLKAEEIREWLVDPVGMRTKTKAERKPPMTKTPLTKEQVEALVSYLQTLK